MNVTHGVSMNGRIHGELKNPDFPPEVEIRRLVGLLDGTKRYSIVLWAMPQGVPFDRVDHKSWPAEYIQAAGSADRLTVEVRRLVSGVPNQAVVGHAYESRGGLELVRWDKFQAEVWSNELFAADEAGEIFAQYYETGCVSNEYVQRQLVL